MLLCFFFSFIYSLFFLFAIVILYVVSRLNRFAVCIVVAAKFWRSVYSLIAFLKMLMLLFLSNSRCQYYCLNVGIIDAIRAIIPKYTFDACYSFIYLILLLQRKRKLVNVIRNSFNHNHCIHAKNVSDFTVERNRK